MRPKGYSSGITDQLYARPSEGKPETYDEAIKERQKLIDDKRSIEAALSNKDLKDEKGKRLEDEDYQRVRHQMIVHKHAIENRLIELKTFIKKENVKRNPQDKRTFTEALDEGIEKICNELQKIAHLLENGDKK